MNSPIFKIKYKDSRSVKNNYYIRGKNLQLAKRLFNTLHKCRGFKILHEELDKQ